MLRGLVSNWENDAFGIACLSRLDDRMSVMLSAGENPTLSKRVNGIAYTPYELCTLPFEDAWALPTSEKCCDIITLALSPWAIRSHFLFPPSFRKCIQRVLLVAEIVKKHEIRPTMPAELWLQMLSFVPRTVMNPFAFM
jgi:hypothetical protein